MIVAPGDHPAHGDDEIPAADAPEPGWPVVSAIVATRDRPELLTKAIAAAFSQDYAGVLEVIIVFDQAPLRDVLQPHAGQSRRTVRVIANDRAAGLAGARNTGILAAVGELVGFCDDDDAWVPSKITKQVTAMRAADAIMSVGGIKITFGEAVHERCPPGGVIDAHDLAHSRLTGAHPSTYLLRRADLLGQLGLVDEAIPYGYGEDYDLLLRVARLGRIVVVPEVLAEVLWHSGSYFSRRWEAMVDGLGYLLAKHPEIAADRRGVAWVQGQRAFALAASGRRREAFRAALVSLRHNPVEPRGLLAMAVASGVLSAEKVMQSLNARGRGI